MNPSDELFTSESKMLDVKKFRPRPLIIQVLLILAKAFTPMEEQLISPADVRLARVTLPVDESEPTDTLLLLVNSG